MVTRKKTHAPSLSKRQREILILCARGSGNKQIAHELGVSEGTIKIHKRILFEKLEVINTTHAVQFVLLEDMLLDVDIAAIKKREPIVELNFKKPKVAA